MCLPLSESIIAVAANFNLFKRSWAFLRRNLSGKYRVIPFGSSAPDFEHLKASSNHRLQDGVYVFFDEPCAVCLVTTDVDLSDIYVPNGGYRGATFELLSYITDARSHQSSEQFSDPPARLPSSVTEGRPSLEIQGNTFANLPPLPSDYVSRTELESELSSVLMDDRHPVVTLQGPGGAGKTSLALHVLHRLADAWSFEYLVWCSARDIELLPHGAKLVAPRILTREDIASFFVELLRPRDVGAKVTDKIDYLAHRLSHVPTAEGPLLLVIDNFETVRNPVDVYRWLDNSVRLPNKILMTTRFRDFKGDYPVEVGGMAEGEFDLLVSSTATRMGIDHLITSQYRRNLYAESEGHPYVTKVLLGEIATLGKLAPVPRLIADKEAILNALFERSFQMMAPASQRVFLTLCNWRSLVPRLAIEAALLRPANERMDIGQAIELLRNSSMVDAVTAEDGEEFLGVPLAAAEFGRRKLAVSPLRSAIETDTAILQSFGAAKATDLVHGIKVRVDRLFSRVESLRRKEGDISTFLPVLEYVARSFPPAWLKLADLYEEEGGGPDLDKARDAVRSYLEARPDDGSAWRRLAGLYRRANDALGEIHALVELAEMEGAPFDEISNTANRLNWMLKGNVLNVDSEERRVLTSRLREAMGKRMSESNATDCSRIAWLCVHLRDFPAARSYVERGLAIEPSNEYCLRLANRLEGEQ